MARFKADDVDNYGGSGGGGYFSLKDDKDTATVRFMYNDIEDVEGFAVHQVEINERKRYVNCLRDYDEPVDKCPFCREGMFVQAKLFIPVYNEDEQRVQTWERGKKFFQKISSLCARFPDLVSHTFEIERNGKRKDTQTTYEIYPVGDADDTTLDDLPEVPDALGTIVLDKSAEDMEYYLDEGSFPPEDDEEPIRRRSRKTSEKDEDEYDEEEYEERPSRTRRSNKSSKTSGRRTPANSKRGKDRF